MRPYDFCDCLVLTQNTFACIIFYIVKTRDYANNTLLHVSLYVSLYDPL